MTATDDDLRATAERLRDALAVYERFVERWPCESDAVPDAVERYLAERDAGSPGPESSPGAALVAEIRELYYEAREAEAASVQRARERGAPDWSRVLAETEPVREAARRVHAAGYGTDPETGAPGYLLPRELCPAALVSMNAGSSPVTFPDRAAQYRAVAERFDRSPDVVYYPGSGHDVSPSEAFPESRVVYVDVDAAAMDDLKRAGYEAVGADAAAHDPETPADLLLFRNAGVTAELVVEVALRPGGLVLANDHLDSASHLAGMDRLELVGVVPDEWSGDSPAVDTVEPDGENRSSESRPAQRVLESGSPLDLYVFRDRT
ncbi:hypothetical protein [Halomicrobium salinisoli]|uniref:hypothetical protein n=1 Tax=Halomicrobium salinisoli TaxID=2878391 RepID=UPI001CF0457B|nr:hypothetical protein [Halomicrobium salinisoli]